MCQSNVDIRREAEDIMIIVDFSAPLNELDAESRTYGCRHTNPEICKKNGLPDICAFVRQDCICKSPSRSWSKQFRILSSKEREGRNNL